MPGENGTLFLALAIKPYNNADEERHIVTGGAGFIGSALVRHLIGHLNHEVTVVDKLTYAANLASLAPVSGRRGYALVQADICDRSALHPIFGRMSKIMSAPSFLCLREAV
jgi:dTDP-D-glucose 4,6-dehydratase